MEERISNNKRVLLLLPTGMTIRNFLTTEILNFLLENPSVEIYCAVKNKQKYSEFLSHDRLHYVDFFNKSLFSPSNILLLILRRRFYEIFPNKTLNILKQGPLFQNMSSRISSFLIYPFPRSEIVFRFLESILHLFHKIPKNILNQIQEIKPHLIVSTHLVAKNEFDYLQAAKLIGIQTTGMVKSFDNLTSKGFLPCKTENVVVWNEIMQKELIDIYQYDKSKVHISGVPQFDEYKKKPSISKYEFLGNMKLLSSKKTILFATNHENISPDDPKIISYIDRFLDQLNAQLIVRLHQMDSMERYRDITSENIIFQVPGIDEGKLSDQRVAYYDFIKDLRDTIYFSDVTINTASTMSLDAIALNRPVINICFDIEERPYYNSVKRFYDFVHYQPIVDTKSTYICLYKEEIIKNLELLLDGNDTTSPGRKVLSQTMLAGNKGNASRRVSEVILGNLGLS